MKLVRQILRSHMIKFKIPLSLLIGVLTLIFTLDLTYPLITSRYKVIDRTLPGGIKVRIENIIQVVVDVKYGFRTIDPDYILTLSQNDITSNDESMSISLKEHGILLDFYKEWRRATIFENGKNIKVKYKIHGSVINLERPSLSVKKKINGTWSKVNKFIRYNEFGIPEQFWNNLGLKYNLMCNSIGEFVLLNDSRNTNLYYLYTDSITNGPNTEFTIVKRNTFGDSYREMHGSELDMVPYNLDTDSLDLPIYNQWRDFLQKDSFANYDCEYIGKYLALSELQGSVHHILGNNGKYIITDSLVFPLWRSEGATSKLSASDYRTIEVFNHKYFRDELRPLSNYVLDKSLVPFRRFFLDDCVLEARIQSFYSFVRNKHEIIAYYDSLSCSQLNLVDKYGDDYIQNRREIDNHRATLENNLSAIEKFLNKGFTVIKANNNNYVFSSTNSIPLNIIFEDSIVEFHPFIYQIETDGSIKPTLQQLVVNKNLVGDFKALLNPFTNDTLSSEIDYSTLYVKNN